MNSLTRRIKQIQSTWKKLAIFGAWICTMAGVFILPLPSWGGGQQQDSFMHFIMFLSTAIAGFTLILTYKKKSKRYWIWVSVLALILFLCSFYFYSFQREIKTLGYDGADVIIGSVLQDGAQEKLEKFNLKEDDDELLKYGDPTKIWTKASISKNRWQLIAYLSLCYCLLAVFIISFTNALILNTTNSRNE